MIDIVPFEPKHLTQFKIARESDRLLVAPLMAEAGYAEALAAVPNMAYSAIINGEVAGCAGLIRQWDNRAVAWALMGSATGPSLRGVTQALERGMDLAGFRRVEAHVQVDYALSIRWHWKLGFHCEALMKCFTPDGKDAFLFARVR